MILAWHNAKCPKCGELNTSDDCKCCRDCDNYPCECLCSGCGMQLDECDCKPEANGTLPDLKQ
jgi:hypothetical protein